MRKHGAHRNTYLKNRQDCPGGPVIKNPPANAEDVGSSLIQEDSMCWAPAKPVPHSC